MTSAGQACGSTSLSSTVPIKVYIPAEGFAAQRSLGGVVRQADRSDLEGPREGRPAEWGIPQDPLPTQSFAIPRVTSKVVARDDCAAATSPVFLRMNAHFVQLMRR